MPRCACFEERGPGALRIRDVAAAAEQSTMGVYTHFGSKQGLLEQLYLYGFQLLEDRLDGVPSDGQGRQELLGVRPRLPRVRARQRSALRAHVRAGDP